MCKQLRLTLELLLVGLQVGIADPAHEKVAEDALMPSPVNESVVPSRTTRRLSVINVSPGQGTLQDALDRANDGDELVLADGTYGKRSGTSAAAFIDKSITIRATNARDHTWIG